MVIDSLRPSFIQQLAHRQHVFRAVLIFVAKGIRRLVKLLSGKRRY
jgi:hypothetical protein